MPDDHELVDEIVLESPSLYVSSGDGWTLMNASRYARQPGVYDVGPRLGLATANMWLVVLGAAESWSPEGVGIARAETIICREGAVLVEFGDGSAAELSNDACWMVSVRSVRRVSNVSMSIARVLLIAAQSR